MNKMMIKIILHKIGYIDRKQVIFKNYPPLNILTLSSSLTMIHRIFFQMIINYQGIKFHSIKMEL